MCEVPLYRKLPKNVTSRGAAGETSRGDSNATSKVDNSCAEADRNVQRFRGGLVFKAHRLLYHSTIGLRVEEDGGNITSTAPSSAAVLSELKPALGFSV